MRYKLYRTAFTIIEMIFVIAIIGVLASLGISYLRRSTFDAKIDTAAQQIQQLLTAATVYYQTNNETWPTTCQQLVPAYITQNTLTNPWGAGYTCAPNTNKKKVFQVITTTTQTNAQQIMAQLPTANTDPSPCSTTTCQVSAEISAPTSLLPTSNIGGIGVGKNGDWATATCPKGKKPKFYTALSEINFKPYRAQGPILPPVEMSTSISTGTCKQSPSDPNTTACQLNIKIKDNQLATINQSKVFYIAVCR